MELILAELCPFPTLTFCMDKYIHIAGGIVFCKHISSWLFYLWTPRRCEFADSPDYLNNYIAHMLKEAFSLDTGQPYSVLEN